MYLLALIALLPQSVPSTSEATPRKGAVHFAKPRLVASGWPDAQAIPLLADVDGDGFGDLLSLRLAERGSLEFAHNVHGGKFGTGAIAVPLADGQSLTPLAAVKLRRSAGKPVEITFHRSDGVILGIVKVDKGFGFAPATANGDGVQLTLWENGSTVLHGDFDGDGKPDEIQDGKLFRAGDVHEPQDLPFLRDLPPGCKLVAGDFQGDGKDDLLVLRQDDTYRLGRDVSVFLAYLDGDSDPDGDGLDNAREAALKTDPLDADTDHDGLLDGWEVLGEGGIDFPALGASPTHKDCFVFVQRYDDTDGARARSEVERAVKYWSTLAAKNPDGTTGIHLVPMWLGPLSAKAGVHAWWECGDGNVPIAARGLAHYIVVSRGGGGQSAELGDMGGCGDQSLYATFLHEFGHQVGLSHSGGPGAGGSPIYPSLMNYAYSYGFNDDYNQIHYSNGELVGLVLDERRLHERVAVPFEKLKFLAKGPYRFRLQADGDGTWVDWNRNGVFDEGVVCANITDHYGVNGGQRFPLGKSLAAPCVVVHGEELLLFTVDKDHHLARRTNLSEGKWSEPVVVVGVAPTGDPCAVSFDGKLRVFIPSEKGIVQVAGDSPLALEPSLLPDTAGCAVSACVFQGKLLVLLWRSATEPVRFCELLPEGTWEKPRDLATVRSEMCVGAVEDLVTGELCVGGGSTDKDKRPHWFLSRLAREGDGSFRERSKVHPGGNKSGWAGNSRPVLLFEGGGRGRLHLIGLGQVAPGANGCFYEAITIGDAAQNDGWRLRRFYDEWTTTRLPLGACWHKGDIVLAFGWANAPGDEKDGNVHVSHHGLGLGEGLLSDYDDVTSIAEVGLGHSLAWRRGSVK